MPALQVITDSLQNGLRSLTLFWQDEWVSFSLALSLWVEALRIWPHGQMASQSIMRICGEMWAAVVLNPIPAGDIPICSTQASSTPPRTVTSMDSSISCSNSVSVTEGPPQNTVSSKSIGTAKHFWLFWLCTLLPPENNANLPCYCNGERLSYLNICTSNFFTIHSGFSVIMLASTLM